MLRFPRAVGSPEQQICNNYNGLVSFYKRFNGKRNCYISHNAYPNIDDHNTPKEVEVANMFFDFDSEDKPENAQLDALKMATYFKENGLSFGVTFSGKKGFHVYLFMEPTTHAFDHSLRLKTLAIHRWLGSMLGLRTIDSKVAEPRRLCRIPLSKNVGGGMYCIPLSYDMLRDLTIPELETLAQKPHIPESYINEGTRHTLDDFLRTFEVSFDTLASASYHGPADIVEYDVPEGPYAEYIKGLIPDPCIHSEIMTHNPRHKARVAALLQIRRSGLTEEEAIEEFDNIAEIFKWVDRHNRENRVYHIKNLYTDRTQKGGYSYPTCSKIRYDYNICIGTSCWKFKRYFNE